MGKAIDGRLRRLEERRRGPECPLVFDYGAPEAPLAYGPDGRVIFDYARAVANLARASAAKQARRALEEAANGQD